MLPLLLALLAFAAGPAHAEPADNPAYLHFDAPHLVHGRQVWLGTCEACHGYGIAGSPVPMQPEDWQARLEQPRETLYTHAIEGHFGPDYTMMPPRGGNENLTNEQVRAAVDYMATLAEHYLQNKGR